MLGAYFSPLAPAAILLLSAFILPLVMPQLGQWRIRDFGAAGLVGVAILSLLGLRLTFGDDATGEGLELLSGWDFSTTESVAGLTVRADGLSLPFLILVLLILLAGTLLISEPALAKRRNWRQVSGWLVMGAGACLLFVAANGLTMAYALMFFDVCAGFYWLGRGHQNLGVARLFLGVFTSAGLMLATLALAPDPLPGSLLLGLALWLRLGLYPFIEIPAHARWPDAGRLVYLGLTMAVAIYLTLRVVSQPFPEIIRWLIAVTMLVGGLLTWLTKTDFSANGVVQEGPAKPVRDGRAALLVWLFLTESLLILLAGPLESSLAVAFAVGLILSLVALWATPALGRPRFGERAWSWPYLPAVVASLNLIGLPLFLGWPGRVAIYQALFRIDSNFVLIMAVLAEGFALSSLVRYWLILVQGADAGGRGSVVGIVAMVPFLTPGLAPFMLSIMTQTDLAPVDNELVVVVLVVTTFIIAAAIGLGYFRERLMARLKIPVEGATELLGSNWLLGQGEAHLNRAGKAVLRVRVTLEGQHYVGWAIFTALVGAIILLLSVNS